MSDKDTGAEAIISDEELGLDKDPNEDIKDLDDPEALREIVLSERKAKKQITIRAWKAEGYVKDPVTGKYVKPPKKEEKPLKDESNKKEEKGEKQITQTDLTAEAVDIKILKSQKVSEDEIAQLKKVAAFVGCSLIEAQSDELYIDWKAKKDAKEKDEKAALGTSKGSGSKKKGKDLNTPGLTDAEHKDLWREQNQK